MDDDDDDDTPPDTPRNGESCFVWKNGRWCHDAPEGVRVFDTDANAVGLYSIIRPGYCPIMLTDVSGYTTYFSTLEETLCFCTWTNKWPAVRYLVQHTTADIHVDNDVVLRAAYGYWMDDGVMLRCLQRVAFSEYMLNPKLAEIMELSCAHYATLLRAFHAAMGRCKDQSSNRASAHVAMDVQHIVVEMLVGTSVMKWFRNGCASPCHIK